MHLSYYCNIPTLTITQPQATGNFDETDGQTILTSVQAFVPAISDTLSAIVTKKAAFQALPIAGILGVIQQDLNNLNTSTAAFETALIAASPVGVYATF